MIQSMTSGRPFRLLFRFSVPLLIGNLFSYCYSITDTVISGRVLGENALAAVGSTGGLIFAQIAFMNGLSGGLSIVTAQRFGANDHDGVRHSVAMSVYIITVVALIISVVCTPTSHWLLERLHTPPEIIQDATQYMMVIIGGSCFLIFYSTLANILRALGDSATPLYFLIFSCLVNGALDYWFLSGLSLGVWSTAAATLAAQALSGMLCLLLIIWKFPILRMRRSDWRWDWPFICEHLRVSVPMGMQWSILAVGSIVLQFKTNELGAAAVAAFVVAGRMGGIIGMTFSSLGTAIGTFDAQNYGAGNFERIRQGFQVMKRMVVYFALAMGFVNLFCCQYYALFFLSNPTEEIIAYVKLCMMTHVPLLIPLGLLIEYRGALQGMGHSMHVFFSGVVEMSMRIGAALLLTPIFGFWGLCMVDPLAWIGAFVQLGIAYHAVMRHNGKEHGPLPSGS